MKKYIVVAIILALMTALIGGCTEVPSGMASLPAGMGRIEVRVTDAPPEYGTIQEIWVTVTDSQEEEGVVVHKAATEENGEGDWLPIPITGANPFELLALKEAGVDALLGWSSVAPGKYTQIRMTIEKVEILFEGELELVEAKLPSGKLKFVRPFDVVDGETTIIMLDFIADKSVTVTGQGKIIFKPVVKLQITQPEGEDNEGELYLGEKDPDGVDDVADNEDDWSIVEDGASGLLKYNLSGDTFDFEFEGEALEPDTSYALIYYADPWPGDNPGALIASGTTDGDGKIELEGSPNLDTDLPNPTDENYDNPVNGQDPPGAKIWLVLSADYNNDLAETGPMTAWNPTEYLFEENTIIYDDTDWEPPTL